MKKKYIFGERVEKKLSCKHGKDSRKHLLEPEEFDNRFLCIILFRCSTGLMLELKLLI
jgi:hypothetical protein